MTDLEALIEFWEDYLECYADGHSPRFIAKVVSTIVGLKELETAREQSSGGEKE